VTSDAIREQVLAANRAFYDAFEALDPVAMEACWEDGDGVACLHPGGPWLHGAAAVQGSWDVILGHTGYIEFDVQVRGLRVADPVAWVTCVERIRAGGAGGVAAAEVAATNVFVLGPQGWRMVLHHGSPVVRGSPGGA